MANSFAEMWAENAKREFFYRNALRRTFNAPVSNPVLEEKAVSFYYAMRSQPQDRRLNYKELFYEHTSVAEEMLMFRSILEVFIASNLIEIDKRLGDFIKTEPPNQAKYLTDLAQNLDFSRALRFTNKPRMMQLGDLENGEYEFGYQYDSEKMLVIGVVNFAGYHYKITNLGATQQSLEDILSGCSKLPKTPSRLRLYENGRLALKALRNEVEDIGAACLAVVDMKMEDLINERHNQKQKVINHEPMRQ